MKKRNRPVFLCKMRTLSDGSNLITDIIGSMKPGAKKMQFPYELPTINVGIDDETKKSLYIATGILAAGFLAGSFISRT